MARLPCSKLYIFLLEVFAPSTLPFFTNFEINSLNSYVLRFQCQTILRDVLSTLFTLWTAKGLQAIEIKTCTFAKSTTMSVIFSALVGKFGALCLAWYFFQNPNILYALYNLPAIYTVTAYENNRYLLIYGKPTGEVELFMLVSSFCRVLFYFSLVLFFWKTNIHNHDVSNLPESTDIINTKVPSSLGSS